MAESKEKVFFQVATFTFFHPVTGDKIIRNFVGQAIFTPEELEAFGDFKLDAVFNSIQLDTPYNPYEDSENMEAHRSLTDSVRNAMKKDEG